MPIPAERTVCEESHRVVKKGEESEKCRSMKLYLLLILSKRTTLSGVGWWHGSRGWCIICLQCCPDSCRRTPMAQRFNVYFSSENDSREWFLENQARANGSCKWRESRNSEALTSTVSQQINVIVSTTADAIVVAVATFHRRVEFVRWRAQHTLKLVFLGSRWSPFYPALEDAAIKIRFTASRWDFHTSTYFTLPRGSDSRRLAVSRRPIGRLSFPHSSQDLFMGFLFTQFTTLQRARRSPRTTWKLASMSGGFWRNPKEESQAMKYCLVNIFGFEKREWMMLVNMIFEFLTRQKHCWWKPFDTCDGEGVFEYCLPT